MTFYLTPFCHCRHLYYCLALVNVRWLGSYETDRTECPLPVANHTLNHYPPPPTESSYNFHICTSNTVVCNCNELSKVQFDAPHEKTPSVECMRLHFNMLIYIDAICISINIKINTEQPYSVCISTVRVHVLGCAVCVQCMHTVVSFNVLLSINIFFFVLLLHFSFSCCSSRISKANYLEVALMTVDDVCLGRIYVCPIYLFL